MFYYSAGLKTHIKHAHQDIISVKGINNPDSLPTVTVKGINNPDSLPAVAAMGSNIENESEPKPSTSTGNDVNDVPTTPVDLVPSSSQVLTNESAPSNQHMTSKHQKRKPKLYGKHYRPMPTSPVPEKAPVKSSKPHFITVTHGLRKPKKHCKFHCKECPHITDSQASANKHYKEAHPPVNCPDCNMLFNNPSSLHHHKKKIPLPNMRQVVLLWKWLGQS